MVLLYLLPFSEDKRELKRLEKFILELIFAQTKDRVKNVLQIQTIYACVYIY